MGGLGADRLEQEGFALARRLACALPMPVWTLDLELERHRETSAAELAVLRFVACGSGAATEITGLMGLGTDTRLAEQVLVRLLGALAVEPKGDRFILTDTGHAWLAAGGASRRDRVTFDVRLDPVRDALEWVDSERSVFATAETWTIELPPVNLEHILTRKPEVARLVRDEPLPDEQERAPHEKRPPVELRGFAFVDQRTHWRAVRLDEWRHHESGRSSLVAHLNDAENPRLTSVIDGFVLNDERRRVVRQ